MLFEAEVCCAMKKYLGAKQQKHRHVVRFTFYHENTNVIPNPCVCDANADQKLPRYCRVHITRRNILVKTNKIVASADLSELCAKNVTTSTKKFYNVALNCLKSVQLS